MMKKAAKIDELSRPRILKPGTDAQKDTSVLMPTSHELMIWITRIRREQRKDSLNPRSAENFLFILYEIVEEWDWPLFSLVSATRSRALEPTVMDPNPLVWNIFFSK
ncbi:hypothetical protein V6N12_035529 [Hibiscus sabdariffa]|uniref:Uncharacterized protein n=1 Tax=Hibiscus sabdariffa TaxID=183260 RepID=A0ABR2EN01_9ROSI